MVFTEQTGLANLYSIVNYCIDLKTCKRVLIARHFNDDLWEKSGICNEMCDYCKHSNKNEIQRVDCLKEAKTVLSILEKNANKSTEKRLTANKLAELSYSEVSSKSKKADYSNSLSQNEIESLILVMLMNQYLKEDFHFTPYNTICYLVAGQLAPHVEYDKNFFMDLIKSSKRKSTFDFVADKNEPENDDSIEEIESDNGLFFDNEQKFTPKNKAQSMDEIIEIDSDDDEDFKSVKSKNKKLKIK